MCHSRSRKSNCCWRTVRSVGGLVRMQDLPRLERAGGLLQKSHRVGSSPQAMVAATGGGLLRFIPLSRKNEQMPIFTWFARNPPPPFLKNRGGTGASAQAVNRHPMMDAGNTFWGVFLKPLNRHPSVNLVAIAPVKVISLVSERKIVVVASHTTFKG